MTTVKIVSTTLPLVEGITSLGEFIAYCARVSNPGNQLNNETAPKLLKYLAKNKHWSPFEMASVTMEIVTTREIAHQIVRHRSFAFQEFCVSGDTDISIATKSTGKKFRMKISEMYKEYLEGNLLSKYYIRIYDKASSKITYADIKEIFHTGKKPVYKVTLDNGKEIKSTKEHKFLTKKGFSELRTLKVGDFIAHNGIPVYQDKAWLAQAKVRAIENKTGVQGIADEAACSYHTIRKWLKKHDLTFSKKEVATYTDPWNKGLLPEEQPMYGKAHSFETREKMRASAKAGEESNLYKNGKYTKEELSFRARVAQVCRGAFTTLKIKQNYKCAVCGRDISVSDDINLGVEVDHIKPVSLYPELAFEESNLQAVCLSPCHADKSVKEHAELAQSIGYSQIRSIEYVGEEDTYDIEVDHSDHNYVANGIITHNSQRYAAVDTSKFVKSQARLQDTKNRQNSILTEDEELIRDWEDAQDELLEEVSILYKHFLGRGLAKEVVRKVLPEGLTPSTLYMAGSIRSWLHYIDLRDANGTQLEHQEVAIKAKEALLNLIPELAEFFSG